MLVVTETNLIQRSFSELAHSEKARILTERHKAIKSQGKRMDIINEIEMMSNTDGYEGNSTSYQFDKKLESNEKLGEKYDLSPANVSRYLRIDMLIDQLKVRLDENEIPFMAGVDLSFLKGEQQEVIESLLEEGYKMDLKKAAALKTLARGNFSPGKAEDIMSGKKARKKRAPRFTAKFTKSIVNQYVTEDRTIKDVEAIIQKLLEEYFAREDGED
jgi:ParB family chromosome partitioning protein